MVSKYTSIRELIDNNQIIACFGYSILPEIGKNILRKRINDVREKSRNIPRSHKWVRDSGIPKSITVPWR